ncbi:MAG: hypothetical protein QMD23_00130 [Candidatus Bathyarchaeia archaeon]|nr:hypothetical protein [Candidatus Bathyarchaeia archaeon]
MDQPILFASLILFAISCLTLTSSILFRSKFNALNRLSKDLKANVFNKTFVVFDPTSEQNRRIHSYLLIWILIGGFTAAIISLTLFFMIETGFALSIFAVFTAINLIVVDDALEVYENAKLFLNAIRNGSKIGAGDLKALSYLRIFTQKLSKYYLCVTIFLFTFSLTLPYIFYPALLAFSQIIEMIIHASSIANVANWQLAVFLFSLIFLIFEIFITKIKGKIFKI